MEVVIERVLKTKDNRASEAQQSTGSNSEVDDVNNKNCEYVINYKKAIG